MQTSGRYPPPLDILLTKIKNKEHTLRTLQRQTSMFRPVYLLLGSDADCPLYSRGQRAKAASIPICQTTFFLSRPSVPSGLAKYEGDHLFAKHPLGYSKHAKRQTFCSLPRRRQELSEHPCTVFVPRIVRAMT